MIKEAGKTADVAKLKRLFDLDGRDKDGIVSRGAMEYSENILKCRKLEKTAEAQGRKFHVEHALAMSLRDNSIFVPKAIMAVMKDFKASQPTGQR